MMILIVREETMTGRKLHHQSIGSYKISMYTQTISASLYLVSTVGEDCEDNIPEKETPGIPRPPS
jgi:hypothetical protein